MNTYVVLLRGINVGGKNKVPMAELKKCLEDLGFVSVQTYIASGNAIIVTDKKANEIEAIIEAELPKRFTLDAELIRVRALTLAELEAVVNERPKGFGDRPETYHSDAVFLMGIPVVNALRVFDPKEGVDKVWPGRGVIYSQRLSALRVKSRLSKIVGTPEYKSMTIRNWNTTLALLRLMKEVDRNKQQL
jgi:uncharacterized protein (DUF1697 family)